MNLILRGAIVATVFVAGSLMAQHCPAWDKQVRELNSTQRHELAQEGAIYIPAKAFIVSGSLVQPCEARLAVSAYVNSVLRGTADAGSRAQIKRYSKDLKAVVLKIWPSVTGSTVLPSDGSLRNEAYGILRGLSSQDLGEVLRRMIASGGLNVELVHLVLEYRTVGVLPDLVSYVKQTKVVNQAIYASGLIAALDPTEGVAALQRVAAMLNLNATQRKVVEGLIKKAQAKKRIVSDDFIDLEYEP